MCTRHVGQVIVVHQIVAASTSQVRLVVTEQLLASVVQLNETEIQAVLRFEERLLIERDGNRLELLCFCISQWLIKR